MQTQLMQPAQPGVPWLERYIEQGGAPERTPLQSLPFTIGRVDTTDLQVNSTRVSREHAVIVLDGDAYHIRDLGSTNGTFVNGKRIEEAVLSDGDVVVIADCEFTFIAGVRPSQRNCATQAMSDLAEQPSSADPVERLLAWRRFQERLLHRGFLPRLHPILELDSEATFAFRAEVQDFPDIGGAHSSRLVARANQLYRLLAAEAFGDLDPQARLLVEISRSDFEIAKTTHSHLLRLNHAVDGRLIIGVPATLVADDARVREWRQHWKNAGLPVAYVNFLGGRTQIEELAKSPPDFLVLDAKATNEIATSPRQTRQLATVVEACETIDCRPIATGLKHREDEDACLKLGLRLAGVDRLGPASAKSLVSRSVQKADERVECLT